MRSSEPLLGEGAQVGEGVAFGAYVVVHPGTVIGNGCEIGDHAVLGRPVRLARHSTAARSDPPAPLVLEDGVRIGAGAVVLAAARLRARCTVYEQAFVRERASVGEGTVIGRGTTVDNDVVVGARVRAQTGVYMTAYSVVEDDVFVGPGVTMTNDSTMSRHGPDMPLRGPVLRRACRVGGGVTLCPGVEIGEEAFVAAGAVVTRDVPPRGVAMGVPARVVREVGDDDLLERWR